MHTLFRRSAGLRHLHRPLPVVAPRHGAETGGKDDRAPGEKDGRSLGGKKIVVVTAGERCVTAGDAARREAPTEMMPVSFEQ